MLNFVHIDTWVVRHLLVITVSALQHKHTQMYNYIAHYIAQSKNRNNNKQYKTVTHRSVTLVPLLFYRNSFGIK